MHATTSHATLQRIFTGLGFGGLLCSAWMTYKFGNTISEVHGIGLVLITVFAAFIFSANRLLAEMGVSTAVARLLMAIGVFAVGLEFVGDLGYTFGMRDKQMVESGAQQTSYKAAQSVVIEDEAAHKAALAARETFITANAWLGSVSADAERTKLAVLDKGIADETANGGCKQRCNKWMKDKETVQGRIAAAEEGNALAKRVEDAKAKLDKDRAAAAVTKVGHSTVKAQTSALARGVLLITTLGDKSALNPDEVEMTVADMIIGLMMAAGATFLPPVAFFIAFFGAAAGTAHMALSHAPASSKSALGNRSLVVMKGASDSANDIRQNLRMLSSELRAVVQGT